MAHLALAEHLVGLVLGGVQVALSLLLRLVGVVVSLVAGRAQRVLRAQPHISHEHVTAAGCTLLKECLFGRPARYIKWPCSHPQPCH